MLDEKRDATGANMTSHTLIKDSREDVYGLLIVSMGKLCFAFVVQCNRLILACQRFKTFKDLHEEVISREVLLASIDNR